jgi:hypothetical protein
MFHRQVQENHKATGESIQISSKEDMLRRTP